MLEDNKFNDYIAMACINVIAIFGLISNGLSLYVARTSLRFHNAFGTLCSSFLLCNLQTIFVHMTWCTIVLSLKSPILSTPKLFFVRLVGVFLNGGWFGSIVLHFFTALNRLCAFVFLTKYSQIWSLSKTLKIVIISWTLTMIYCTHHLYEECSFLFNYDSTYRWLLTNSVHGGICSKIDGLLSLVVVIAMICVDFITLIKMLAYVRSMKANNGVINEKEIIFFKQSCNLSLIYITFLAGFNLFPYLFDDKWTLFIFNTMAWILTHSLDGLIFLLYNWKLIHKKDSGTRVMPATNLNLFQTTN